MILPEGLKEEIHDDLFNVIKELTKTDKLEEDKKKSIKEIFNILNEQQKVELYFNE